MRILVLAILTLPLPAFAEGMWEAEIHLGMGVETSPVETKRSPLSIEGIGSYAFEDDPPLSAYGGFSIETLDKSSIGTVFGVKLSRGMLRAAAGGTWVFAPYTLWGAQGSLGACKKMSESISACGDVKLTEYFAGTDLPMGTALTEVQLGMGLVIE